MGPGPGGPMGHGPGPQMMNMMPGKWPISNFIPKKKSEKINLFYFIFKISKIFNGIKLERSP